MKMLGYGSAILLLILVPFIQSAAVGEAGHRVGAGAHYFTTTEDIGGAFEDSGVIPFLSYQFLPHPMFRLEANLELFEDGYAGSRDDVFAPQLYLLGGAPVYGGVGIGYFLTNQESADSPFLALRVGYEYKISDALNLVVDASYIFDGWEGINEIDEDEESDTVTVGASIHFNL
jgi:hypothetical protein